MSIEEIHQAVLKFKLNDIEALVEDEIKFTKNYDGHSQVDTKAQLAAS